MVRTCTNQKDYDLVVRWLVTVVSRGVWKLCAELLHKTALIAFVSRGCDEEKEVALHVIHDWVPHPARSLSVRDEDLVCDDQHSRDEGEASHGQKENALGYGA